jgi:prepilin-type N-terminal cleavage/methylation domain-containing protein
MQLRPERPSGFTIIELLIAIVILVILLGLAVPSMNGVFADRRLRRSLDAFNGIVREAQERSVTERRPYLVIWQNGKIGLRAEGLNKGESPDAEVKWKLERSESLKIKFPAALVENPPAEWIFWSSGNCEPAEVTYRGKDGDWTSKYSALTGQSEIVAYATK